MKSALASVASGVTAGGRTSVTNPKGDDPHVGKGKGLPSLAKPPPSADAIPKVGELKAAGVLTLPVGLALGGLTTLGDQALRELNPRALFRPPPSSEHLVPFSPPTRQTLV